MSFPCHLSRAFCAAILLGAGLIPLGAAEQKKIVVDFEDVGTWRMRESTGIKRGAWWPADLCLSSSNLAKSGDSHVGELKFAFDPNSTGPFVAGFDRQKMSLVSGFLTGIEFEADARDFPVSVCFDLQDATNHIFRTVPVPLTGKGWQHYRLDLKPETVPGLAKCKFPARLKRILVKSATACEGAVFLDDIALTGSFTRKDQITLTPIYEGISYPPGQPVTLRYRLRSAQAEALAGNVHLELRDFAGKKLLEKDAPVSVPAAGEAEISFSVGEHPIGAYEVALTAKAGEYETTLQDHFGAFMPNNGRPNHHPMWFGIGDASSWQGDGENALHLEWMKALGVDIDRVGFYTDRFEPERGMVVKQGWDQIIHGHAQAGVDVMLLYGYSPVWTQTKPKRLGAPDLWPIYDEHARDMGNLLKEYPNVRYLEFWNEPDLDFFDGTLAEYLKMLEHISKAVKEARPDLKVLSGGVTVRHPREKPGFSKGMYQQGAEFYDIAAYHAHGPAINNEQRQQQVEAWLKEAGLSKHYVNTETGERSLYDAEGRKRQAITLIKKIVYSKSVPDFDAYFWFTLQDYWDMDPDADDSFGLITSDNRAKPSFVAYNALIKILADTTPEPDAPNAPGLTLHTFRKDDGRYVYAGWPADSKSGGLLWLKTAQSVEVADMFGAAQEYAPLGSVLPISFVNQPLYISGRKPGEKITVCAPGEEFLKVPTEIEVSNEKGVSIPVVFRNPAVGLLQGALTLKDATGKTAASQDFKVDGGKEFSWPALVSPAKSESYETSTWTLGLNFSGTGLPAFSFPIQLIPTYPIQKVAALAENPANWPAIESGSAITLNRFEQVVELTYDPSIPSWRGPDDLSAVARAVHDNKGIRFHIEVTDDTPGPVQTKDHLWLSDDVQVAFGAPEEKNFAVLDLGRTAEGPAVWCSQNPDARQIGAWQVPISIVPNGKVTTYDVYLPYEKLGLSLGPLPQSIRFSFMVNENDGKGRVRWIQWKDGIGKNRSVEGLGHGLLER